MNRIKLASSLNITLNTISRNLSDKIYQSRICGATLCTMLINLALTLIVKDLQLAVMGVIAVLNTIFFITLVLKLSKIKSMVHGNIINACKRAISYNLLLIPGFILDMIILFVLRVLVRKNLLTLSVFKIVHYLFYLKFAHPK